MQTLRLVGDNMAWLLRSMTAAREAGVVPYEREVRVKTNFYKPGGRPQCPGGGLSSSSPLLFTSCMEYPKNIGEQPKAAPDVFALIRRRSCNNTQAVRRAAG